MGEKNPLSHNIYRARAVAGGELVILLPKGSAGLWRRIVENSGKRIIFEKVI